MLLAILSIFLKENRRFTNFTNNAQNLVRGTNLILDYISRLLHKWFSLRESITLSLSSSSNRPILCPYHLTPNTSISLFLSSYLVTCTVALLIYHIFNFLNYFLFYINCNSVHLCTPLNWHVNNKILLKLKKFKCYKLSCFFRETRETERCFCS